MREICDRCNVITKVVAKRWWLEGKLYEARECPKCGELTFWRIG